MRPISLQAVGEWKTDAEPSRWVDTSGFEPVRETDRFEAAQPKKRYLTIAAMALTPSTQVIFFPSE